jgi:hypothetical protein
MTVLAHLTGRFVTQAENLATEALAYILAQHPAAGDALIVLARGYEPALPERLIFRTQVRGEDGAIPDLTGGDATGEPLMVEVKFWARLTDNQPVTYLRRLPAGPGLLLFVAPEARRELLWSELIRLSKVAGLALGPDRPGETVRSVEEHTLALTSWRQLLVALRAALELAGDHDGLSDLRQLEGLTELQDREAFLPIEPGEFTSSTGQRLAQLGPLITDTVDAAVQAGFADVTGLRTGTGWGQWYGRYFLLSGWVCFLHVNFVRWGTQRATPLWLRISGGEGNSDVLRALAPLRQEDPPRLIESDGLLQVPIFLAVGVERDEVRADLDKQLRQIHELLATCPPPPSQTTPPSDDHPDS